MKKEISQNSKLVGLLTEFSRNSEKKFKLYIESPLFNRRTDLLRLSEILFDNIHRKRSISQLELVQALYPNNHKSKEQLNPSDSVRLRNAMSKLMGLAEDFLVYEYREQRDAFHERDLIEALMVKKLYKHARIRLASGLKRVSQKNKKNRTDYYDLFLLKEVEYTLNIIERNRSVKIDSESYVEAFERYFLSNIFLYYCAAIDRSKTMNYDYHTPLAEDLSDYVVKNLAEMPAITRIYYSLFSLLGNKQDVAYFDETKQLIFDSWEKLSDTDLRQMLNVLLNFCNRELRNGKLEYRHKKFELYQAGIQSEIWTSGLYFSPHQFCHFVQTALDSDKLVEAKAFINSHSSKLSPLYQVNIINLSQAFIAFAQGDFDDSHCFLRAFSLKEDFYYKLAYKVLLIKLYYEQKEFNPLTDALNSFRVFLNPKRNNDWSQDFLQACKAFYLVTTKLAKASFVKNGKKNVLKELNNAPVLYERIWLLEKVKEL